MIVDQPPDYSSSSSSYSSYTSSSSSQSPSLAARKRPTTEQAVEERVHQYQSSQSTPLLNSRTFERVHPPEFRFLFDTFNKVELGRGVQGVVYDTTILPASEVRFPPHLNTRDHYAIKLQTVTDDTIMERKDEVDIGLWIAQIERPTPNVMQMQFWLRLSTPADEKEQYCTIMPLVSGGTLGSMLANAAYLRALYASSLALHRMLAGCILQAFAGVCEVQAGGVAQFMHGDLHYENVLREQVTAPHCFLFDLGNGTAAVAPSWECNNSKMVITDVGFSSGMIGEGATAEGIAPHSLAVPDNHKLCLTVLKAFKGFLNVVGGSVREALSELKRIIDAAQPNSSVTAEELRDFKDGCARLTYATDHCLKELSVDHMGVALTSFATQSRESIFRLSNAFIEETSTTLEKIPEAVDDLREMLDSYYQALSTETSNTQAVLMVLEQLAFLQAENRPLIELLRTDPFFEVVRVDTTDIPALQKHVLARGQTLKNIEFSKLIELAPAQRGVVHHVNARLSG